jgi:hypothetical protein
LPSVLPPYVARLSQSGNRLSSRTYSRWIPFDRKIRSAVGTLVCAHGPGPVE